MSTPGSPEHEGHEADMGGGPELAGELAAIQRQQAAAGRNDEALKDLDPEAFAAWQASHESDFPRKIEAGDLEPQAIGPGETLVVLQRHPKYNRGPASEGQIPGRITDPVGSREADAQFFEEFLSKIPKDERDKVDVLFLGSDTQYHGEGRRSFETAQIAQEAVASVFEAHGLPPGHIYGHMIGTSWTNPHLVDPHDRSGFSPQAGSPEPMAHLSEPNVFNDSPDFVAFLKAHTGGEIGLQFFIALEEDTHAQTRQEMGAEGPDDIADRTAYAVRLMGEFAKQYHEDHPDRRLVIWAGTHYDTISPLVKRDVLGAGKEHPLQVEYAAGITVKVDGEGHGTTKVAGHSYVMPLDAEPPTYQRKTPEQAGDE